MGKEKRRFWRITMLYHGAETLIAEIPTTHITENALCSLMLTIFAKYTLSDPEIVASYLRANVTGYRHLLSIQQHRNQDPISFMVSDGSNWVHAIVVRPEDQGKLSSPPALTL